MQAITVSVGPLAAADPNGIAETQTTAGAANLVLDGVLVTNGVANLDTPRVVLITSAGNDASITFTVTGTTFGGQQVSETVKGVDTATVSTTLDFLTVTSVSTSGATSASGVIVGTSAVAGSSWVRFDDFAPAPISIQCNVTGTVTYTVQSTLDDPNDPFAPTPIESMVWINSSDTNVVNASASKQSGFTFAPKFARVKLLSGTGSVSGKFLQSSNGPI